MQRRLGDANRVTIRTCSSLSAAIVGLEFRIGLNEWLKRIPRFSLKPGAEIRYTPGGVVGPDSVPLVW